MNTNKLEMPENTMTTTCGITETYVICPKHGTHQHTIQSTITGYEGTWCMICALEKLGEPLETEQRPWSFELQQGASDDPK
jgi:hypothetical protein